MKDYRFYLEYKDAKEKRKGTRKNLGNHSGNCIAIPLENGRPYYYGNKFEFMDAFGGVLDYPNSDVCNTGCYCEYLRERCKRISEAQARQIHPKLFNYLEQ
jgi:hypothetical protein